jgi:hypothetical protein
MDEDYARKLRAWLRAEPGATPRRADEEREWLREVPAPAADGGRVAGDRHPAPAADAGSVAGEQHTAPAAEGGWAVAGDWPAPGSAGGDASAAADRGPAPQPGSGERWSVRGQLPAPQPELEEEWVCPVIALPVPRSSQENGCRMSGPAARNPQRRTPAAADHPPTPPADQRAMTEAEARSRWNHPSNWHRRRREAQAQDQAQDQDRSNQDEPGSR